MKDHAANTGIFNPEKIRPAAVTADDSELVMTVIGTFYPENTPLRELLLRHSRQVRDKALALLAASGRKLDVRLVADGAMLHDIGIGSCHAPKIYCEGILPYIAHGVAGAEMLRRYGAQHGIDLEVFARICERHTGSGITAAEVRAQQLPIPVRDYLPETPEEKLVCLADKFFSKSGNMREKSLEHIRKSMEKFGSGAVDRFDELCRFFGVH